MKVCLVSSSGGHYEQLKQLKKLKKFGIDYFIITEKTSIHLEAKYYFKQVNRKELLWFFLEIYNAFISLKVLLIEKPDAIISTGALCSIPILLLAKVLNIKTIFIESFAKIESPTITGKICYKFVDSFIVQWESMLKIYPNAILGGSIY